jgi:hypothetical protein
MAIHRYETGEEVTKDDRVTYRGESGHVEFVVSGDDPTDWYVQRFGEGGGLMLRLPSFGSLFLAFSDGDDWLDGLEFVGRKLTGSRE